jgi:hypothetical protein
MSEVSSTTNPLVTGRGPNMRTLVLTMIIDAALPFLIYQLLTPRFPSGSVTPLLIATIFPALGNVISIIRQRRLDYLGFVILIGIVCSLVFALITGNQKFLLIRESFLTLAYGIVCLGSLLFPKPIMFYIGRHFATGNDPAKIAYYNALWHYPAFRRLNRLVTMVWGIVLLGEFAIRLMLVYTLTVAQVLAISPVVTYGILIALIGWTIMTSSRAARRSESLHQQRHAAEQGQATTAHEQGQ